MIEIISFYEFKDMSGLGDLGDVRSALRQLFLDLDIRGTIILADEGFNGMVCGTHDAVARFITRAGEVLQTNPNVRSSFAESAPFRKVDIKIKPEIVTLKRKVNMRLSESTHVNPRDWNSLISDPGTVVLDARNHYEYTTGTFRNAVDPHITKFSELPEFVEKALDPNRHKTIAMFCTGGIRCEKFAPYLRQLGFENVFQLEGGILKYLEEVPAAESLWQGECFVFDERITVTGDLRKGTTPDHSQRRKTKAAG